MKSLDTAMKKSKKAGCSRQKKWDAVTAPHLRSVFTQLKPREKPDHLLRGACISFMLRCGKRGQDELRQVHQGEITAGRDRYNFFCFFFAFFLLFFFPGVLNYCRS